MSRLTLDIENYRALTAAAHDSVAGVFDPVVVKVLLPVTSILGYIFGTRGLRAPPRTNQSRPS